MLGSVNINVWALVIGAIVTTGVGMLLNQLLVQIPKRVGELERAGAVQAEVVKNMAADLSALTGTVGTLTSKMDSFVVTQGRRQSDFLADLMKIVTKGDRRKPA